MIQRYDIYHGIGDLEIIQDDDGEWCKAEDVKRLKEQLEIDINILKENVMYLEDLLKANNIEVYSK